jgi:hypothetical protein
VLVHGLCVTNGSNKAEEGESPDAIEPDFRRLEFPSDALSVKRFRRLFPAHFDCQDTISEAYTSNDFFYPADAGRPDHLVRLTEMIQAERIVAAGAYSECFLDRFPDLLDRGDYSTIRRAKEKLEEEYLFFKLADSPESARLLIRQIEEDAKSQVRGDQQKYR